MKPYPGDAIKNILFAYRLIIYYQNAIYIYPRGSGVTGCYN